MDKTIKGLIIIVIILVAILGIATGIILQGFIFNKNNTTITTNQTNNTTQNSTNTQQSNPNNSNNNQVMISADQAMQIATNYLGGYNVYGGGASLSEGNGHPIWIVYLYSSEPQFKGKPAGQCAVDAVTGEFLG